MGGQSSNGLSSDVGWDEPSERAAWERARATLLLAGGGLAWAALCAASGLAAPLYLSRMHDRATATPSRESEEDQ